jgi:hypothetical protein
MIAPQKVSHRFLLQQRNASKRIGWTGASGSVLTRKRGVTDGQLDDTWKIKLELKRREQVRFEAKRP